MARGNRNSAVRGNRSAAGLVARQKMESEVELTIRDGMRVLRLVFRGAALVIHFHERGETEEARRALQSGVVSLAKAAGRVGLRSPAIAELILDRIMDEVGLMYDAATTERLAQALRRCLNRVPDENKPTGRRATG
jgi:hypothetical protein